MRFKKILTFSAAALMLASVGAGSTVVSSAHAAKLSSFPPSVTKVVKLTKSLKADNVYNPGTMKLRVKRNHTKLYRGERLKVDLAEAEGFGFNVRNRQHPETDYRGYSLPVKDAKYFKIIKHGYKRVRKHYRRKALKRHARRHARRSHRRYRHRR